MAGSFSSFSLANPALSKRINFAATAIVALLCTLSGFALQSLIVKYRYGGNWTALFCTSSTFQVPPALAGDKLYIFPNSNGYDGQMYHVVAHDPLLLRDYWRYMDTPRVRYRRILLPAIAFLMAAGRQPWIDVAYVGANLLFLFLGTLWISQYLDLLGLRPIWGALFFLAPATLISLDRLTLDLTFTSLCIGFALYLRLGKEVNAYILLVLACLCRDTGFILTAGACLALLVERRIAKAMVFATAILPATIWSWRVQTIVPDQWDVRLGQFIPVEGIVGLLQHPLIYPLEDNLNTLIGWLDRLSMLGFVVAALFTVWLVRRYGFGQVEVVMILLALVGLCLPRTFWLDAYSGPRVFTPLLIYVALRALPEAGWKSTIPLLMETPRVAAQIGGPLLLMFWEKQH